MPRREREEQDECQREPLWSESQALQVELMQPQRSDDMPTSLDTIKMLRKQLDAANGRAIMLQRIVDEVYIRVLPALARLYDHEPRCTAASHSTHWRCHECDLRSFLKHWRHPDTKPTATVDKPPAARRGESSTVVQTPAVEELFQPEAL